ncbi:hypothetical protein BC835DRAFT_1357380 [Cytidiella melzeri]|nr:hypothetical protein BC835DRAFT_1357380 [Cytidiella melzeri]
MMQSDPEVASTSTVPPQPGPSTFTRAPKGKACLNCRRRKLKCDCARPVCSQCIRYGRERDCEYTDKHQLSRTEMLEETIVTLRARVRELEHLEEDHSPFAPLRQSPRWRDHSSSGGSRSPDPFDAVPTYLETQTLVQAFLPYCTDVGFCLNINRFLGWIFSPISSVSPASREASTRQPIICKDRRNPLLWAVFVWGATFADNPDLKQHVHSYLSNALQSLSISPPSSNSKTHHVDVLHRIQSEILIANYFLNSGQFVEARQHISSATSLVSTYDLHKIRSHHTHDPSLMYSVPGSEPSTSLPPPLDTVEEGERISVFWQVYILDKTWSTVLGKPSFLNEAGSTHTYIDTPWPLAVEQYVEGPVPSDYGVAGRTLHRFLYEAQNFQPPRRLPTLALRAQAAALLDRALVLSSSCALDPRLRALNTTEIENLEALINRFLHFLGTLRDSQAQHSAEWMRSITVTQCLTRLASMQLYFAWFEEDIKSASKVMCGCKAIMELVQYLPPLQLRHMDPLLPVMLTSVAQVCCNEQLRMRNPMMYNRQLITCTHPFYLEQTVENVAKLLTIVNGDSILSALQHNTVESYLSMLVVPSMNSTMNLPL